MCPSVYGCALCHTHKYPCSVLFFHILYMSVYMYARMYIGTITSWQEVDLAYIRAVMRVDVPQLTKACIAPSVEQISIFSEHLTQVILYNFIV